MHWAPIIVSLIVGFGIGDWYHTRFKPTIKKTHRNIKKRTKH